MPALIGGTGGKAYLGGQVVRKLYRGAALMLDRTVAATATLGYVNDGDSITHGYGITPTYPDILTQITGLQTTNLGVSGRKLADAISTFESRGIPGMYSATGRNTLIIQGCNNDIRNTAGITLTMLQGYVAEYVAKGRAAGFKVLVTTLGPATNHTTTQANLTAAFNTWIKANWQSVCDGLVDWTVFPELGTATNTYFFWDGIHQTTAGLYLMAEGVRAATGAARIEDTVPAAFAFTAQTGANPGATATSAEITVSGSNGPAPISVEGGSYSINGGAFTAAPGTIYPHARLRVQRVASAAASTPASAIVSIGGVLSSFTVTTAAVVAPASRYFTDFSEFPAGQMVAPWADLPGDPVNLGPHWRFVDVGGVMVLQMNITDTEDTGAYVDRPEGGGSTGIELYAEGRTSFNNNSSLEVIIVGGNIATSPRYRFDLNPASDQIRCRKYAGTTNAYAQLGPVPGISFDMGINDTVCMRVRVEGAELRAKAWRLGTSEPGWQYFMTDPAPLVAPLRAGVHSWSGRPTSTWYKFGVGVNGVSAPSSPVVDPVPTPAPTSTVNPETDIENLPRVFISTDLKMDSVEKDDAQSLIHALLYQDRMNIVGMSATVSKWGVQDGRLEDVLATLDAYEFDQPKLIAKSQLFKTAAQLRAVSFQGATVIAPTVGWSTPTAGSQAIQAAATAAIAAGKQLNVLCWGGETDIAQALHDQPTMAPHVRLFTINRQDDAAFDYIKANFQTSLALWVDNQVTYGGVWRWNGSLLIPNWHDVHAPGHGALGDLFYEMSLNLHGQNGVKMGDSPTVFRFIVGDQNNPAATGSWGGRFRQITTPNYYTDLADTTQAAATISQYRQAWLDDLQARFDWLL